MQKSAVATLVVSLILLLFSSVSFALTPGDPAPDFELASLEGKKIRLSDFKGQIILLKLATTWCPTCRQQSEEIAEIEPFLQENKVAVIEVFLQDSEEMIRKYLAGQKLSTAHLALVDDGQAHKAYNVYLIPRVLIIGPDFKVSRDGSLMPSRDLMLEVKKVAGKTE